ATGGPTMLATELLFVYVYCLIDDAMKAGVLVIPRHPGPVPACTDAELLTIAVIRRLLGRRSENGFLAEIRRDWPGLFPQLPDQPQVNRRTRWLWGASGQLRAGWAAAVPPDPVQQIDTSALPVKHPSRVRGPDGWTGPGNDLAARFGRDGAHAGWFYGFRLAIRTDLGRRIVRAWSIVPAAVDERQIGTDLTCGGAAMIGALLLDRGFTGRRFAAEMASAQIEVLIPPTRAQRKTMPKSLQRLIARLRNRVETSFKEITDQMELARHGAHTFEGLLTRTAATLAAHTLLLTQLADMT
ncbi:MAG: transposase, partial [Streptosporangiaceae bacterium]